MTTGAFEQSHPLVTVPLQPFVTVNVQGFSRSGHGAGERCAVLEPVAPGQDLWVSLRDCAEPELTE